MSNIDQENAEYFYKFDNEKAHYFKKLDTNCRADRVKTIVEMYELRRERLREHAKLKAFEEAFQEFLAECEKEEFFGIAFSLQVENYSSKTGISLFLVMHMSMWMKQNQNRIDAVRKAINSEPAPTGAGGSAAPAPEQAPKEFWELGEPS